MTASSIGSFNVYWKAALVAGGLAAWSLPVWNVVVNPYQVFKAKYSIGERYTASTTNERFLKVEYLLNEAQARSPATPGAIAARINNGNEAGNPSARPLPDAFIVGSSIMGLMDPGLVNRYFPDRHFYNLAFLAAKPDEILASLQALKRGGVPIKTLVYGLEPIAFTDRKTYGPAYWLHPETGGPSRQRVAFDYLFAPSLADGLSRLVTAIGGQPSVRYDIEGTGRYVLERYDREIKADHAAFMRRQFPVDAQPVVAPPWIESRFEDFHKLVQWLKEEQVETRFYLNPLHPYVINAYGENRLAAFKAKIAGITGQGLEDCTQLLNRDDVNQQFYDYKHFLPEKANLVISCGLQKDQSNFKGLL
ncbi:MULTISPECIES: hypothetical protein [unclassified Methylobacter]|jgi:hypothetical protein|uniref:hypothetical protein n=1 Tax=unclassified Methylobacter TaxID=2635283 RepID=UPI001893E901|nr:MULTISPECIES: hypothetical protein [unclassified Methylobacter]MBF6650735.1 hypothetical protein [Methylobacter sp. BlB1]WAK04501.1 DUF1574 domain-containing protein [Methylobacter sp. YRD-M1]